MGNDQFLDMTSGQQGLGFFKDLLQVQCHHDVGAGIGCDVPQLGYRIERIAIDHRAASTQHAVIGNGVKGRIGQHQGDACALGNAELALQRSGKGDDLFGQFAKAGCAAQKVERHGARILGTGRQNLFMHWGCIDLVVPDNALGIACDPGAKAVIAGSWRVHRYLLPMSETDKWAFPNIECSGCLAPDALLAPVLSSHANYSTCLR